MKKQIVSILNSILVITAVAILVGGGSWAFFSDAENSPNYSALSGKIDLRISDKSGNGHGRVRNTWVMANAMPGVTIAGGSIWFRNAGTIDADHLEIVVSNKVVDLPGPESDTEEGTTDMDRVVQITKMEYVSDSTVINCLALLEDANGNGFIDLDDLEAQGIDNLPSPKRSSFFSSRLDMDLRFHESADNDYQGDKLYSEFAFTLNQSVSQ